MNVEPEKIKALIDILQSMLVSSTDDTAVEVEPEPIMAKQKTTKKIKSSSKRTSKSNFVNKFDSMPEKNLHKEDVLIDKKLCVKPPVARARHFEFIDATCRVCRKTESINPAILTDSIDRYKCNKCSTSPG